MADEQQPRDPDEQPSADEEPSQDPYVARLRPDPSQPAQRVIVLSGLRGDSDRDGYRRLYLTRDLDYYAEFRAEDVVHTEPIPADQPPFMGLDATSVSIRRGATIEYTWARTARPLDEFDLDIRLGPAVPERFVSAFPTRDAECPGPSFVNPCPTDVTCGCGTVQITVCRGGTCIEVCDTARTCITDCRQRPTCGTCDTRCGQPTCEGQTCRTCQTCQTQCGQDTCVTCRTQCGTCATCNQVTCRPPCVEP